MARVDRADIISDAAIRHDASGYHVVRKYIVVDITDDPESKTYAALHAPGIPQYSEPHPIIPNCYAQDIAAKMLSHEQAEVIVTYGPGGRRSIAGAPARIEIGGGLQSITSNRDAYGDLIYTWHDYDPLQRKSVYGDKRYQMATVQREIPATIKRFVQLETQDPTEKASRYKGRINSAPYLGFPARWWFCRDISGTSTDGGLTYEVTYELLLIGETGGDTEVAYTDEATGQIPTDVIYGAGIRRIVNYLEADFNGLGIR